jgi:NTE family protein
MKQRHIAIALLVATGLGAASRLHAQPGDDTPGPRIGLVLSGGGAKGFAHLGVLKVLEEYRVPVHVITGTSMGSIMGGLYASGLSIEDIESTLGVVDWVGIFEDQPPREDLDFGRKEEDLRYLFDLGVGYRWVSKLVVPGGVLAGQKVELLLRELTLHTVGIDDFAQFPIPFACVAADIEHGTSYVLDHGDLARSIRASMSIPGAFAPVEIDGRLLVDGGITDNMPVEQARSMGAEVVIGVDVSDSLRTREELSTLFGVVGQMTAMLTRLNVEKQIPNVDVLLVPERGELTGGDFTKFAEFLTIGEAVARAHESELRRYSVSEAEYAAYRERHRWKPAVPERMDFIEIVGNDRVDRRVIEARMKIRPGDPLDPAALAKDMTSIYGLGDFRLVEWEMAERGGEQGVLVRVVEKPWGPHYLNFGMVLEPEGSFIVRFNVLLTRLNSRGAELRNDIQFGSTFGFSSEFYQPLNYRNSMFVAGYFGMLNQDREVFDDDGDQIATYEFDRTAFGGDLGFVLGRHGELRLGVVSGLGEAQVVVGAADLPEFDADLGGLRVRLALDRLDSPNIPTKGYYTNLDFYASQTWLGADDEYEKLTLRTSHFWSRGRLLWNVAFLGGSSLGSETPGYDQFTLGGLFSLNGLQQDQLRGRYAGRISGRMLRRLGELPNLVGRGVYVGGVVDTGQAWERGSEIFEDLVWSGGALFAVDTFMGPFFLVYAITSTGQDEFYVTLGKNF